MSRRWSKLILLSQKARSGPNESRCKKIASGQLGVECLPYRSQKENPVACLSKPLFLGQSLFTFECRVASNTHR